MGIIAARELKMVASWRRTASQKPEALKRGARAQVALSRIAGSTVWAWALMWNSGSVV